MTLTDLTLSLEQTCSVLSRQDSDLGQCYSWAEKGIQGQICWHGCGVWEAQGKNGNPQHDPGWHASKLLKLLV